MVSKNKTVVLFPLLSGIFFIGSALILASKWNDIRVSPKPEGLHVNPTVLNLGQVSQGKKVTSVFIIKNHSKKKITQVRLISSCGCTIVSKVPETFMPGESFQPKIEFSSFGKRGNAGANLILEYLSSSNHKESKIIEVVAEVKPKIKVHPTKLIFSTNDKLKSEHMIRLSSVNEKGFQIDRISVDHFAFDSEEIFGSANEIESDLKTRSVRVLFDANRWRSNVKRMGKITDFKLLIKTNVKSEPDIEVPIEVVETI